MQVNGQPYRTIWLHPQDHSVIQIIDQRNLPHEFIIADLRTVDEVARAIKEMWVRGAPLIGGTAAYGMYLAVKEAQRAPDPEAHLERSCQKLLATRPTAVNLHWAVGQQMKLIEATGWTDSLLRKVLENANTIVDEDVQSCKQIGEHGLEIIEKIYQEKQDTINILTHCNAGWLATIDWGTATSPIYHAHDKGIPVHVWVDETRPRNQGARITAWELAQHGVPHTIITDNAGGHLMQHGQVDLCIVGSDRTTCCGDVANKVGTYLKALAAHDNGVPFYVALPASTIDFAMRDGVKEIPIEERGPDEVTHIQGWSESLQKVESVRLSPAESPAANYAFDVTPARLVTGLITERGVCDASEVGIRGLFPDLVMG